MNFIIAIFLLAFPANPTLEKIRGEFALVGVDQVHVQNLQKLCSQQTGPVSEAYAAGAEMASAQYLFNPVQKLSVFQSGKNKLEALLQIPENARSPEIRFIRYCVQLKCPAILGYTKNRKEDKTFILYSLPDLKHKEPDLWKFIVSFLLLHDTLSQTEKQTLLQ